MAWKLKKWKSSEAEEQQAPEQGFEVAEEPQTENGASDSLGNPFAPPAPHAFTPSSFAEQAPAPIGNAFPAPPAPQAAIPIAPAPEEGAPEIEFTPVPHEIEDDPIPAAPTSLHDLDAVDLDNAPTPLQFSQAEEEAAAAEIPDYFAASASSAHEVLSAFQPVEEENTTALPAHSGYEFVPVAQEPTSYLMDLDAQAPPAQADQEAPASAQPEAITPPPMEAAAATPMPIEAQAVAPPEAPEPPAQPMPEAPAASAPSPQPERDSLDAFAPYKPSAAPPPEPERFIAVDESASQSVTPPPAAGEANGRGLYSAPANDFEDTLSFAPVASSRLIVKIGPFTANYEINKPELTIGRPDPKTGTSPDIALEWDDAVSRRHARVIRKNDGDYIEDVGSSNGTLLNGQPIAVNTPILLKDGDTITIGERTQISYLR